jgi:hypothetical protein
MVGMDEVIKLPDGRSWRPLLVGLDLLAVFSAGDHPEFRPGEWSKRDYEMRVYRAVCRSELLVTRNDSRELVARPSTGCMYSLS